MREGGTFHSSYPWRRYDRRARHQCRGRNRGRDCGRSDGKLTIKDCAAISRKHRKYLEVIVQGYDIAMRLGYLLEDGNLVPDLGTIGSAVCAGEDRPKK